MVELRPRVNNTRITEVPLVERYEERRQGFRIETM